MFEKLPLWLRKTLAWSVHLFTGTGAIWGFLTILAIFEENWRAAIWWMIIAMVVDGVTADLAVEPGRDPFIELAEVPGFPLGLHESAEASVDEATVRLFAASQHRVDQALQLAW